MPTNTYVALDKKTLGTSAASVNFTSISQLYTDLILIVNTSGSQTQVRLQFNSDTGSNYSTTILYGDGSSTGSVRVTDATSANVGGLVGELGTNIIHLNSYSNTVKYKTIVSTYGFKSGYAETGAKVNLWRNTNAISSMLVFPTTGVFDAGSTFSLYGIAASSVAAKATGGIISADSTYYYHTFASSGVFTPSQSLSCDYFIVAGGGGAGATVGGGWAGGGGGGGGYRTFTSVSFASGTAYTATIGAGGAGGSGSGGTGSVGGNTTLIGGAISSSASGGGGGGTSKENGNTQTNGTAGGSGGGAPQNTVAASGGAGNSGGYSPVEGYAGYSTTGSPIGPGQGGGAGGVGQIGVYPVPTALNGITAFDGNYYASGGAARWLTADTMNGAPFTGNGGYSKNDGTGSNYTGGTGGSGIVVIRYAKA